ncbi:MAG: hypothetical protein JSW26_13250 [Desulfobacterales bacterium]|nr:MAG: hypothetical protein JSW26_13250 [Desulfobacterales bacterium]
MKKNIWLLILMSSVAWTAFGCTSSAVTGVPEGSVLISVYEGTFSGAFNEGSIEVKLHRSPDGSELCYGHFEEEGSYLNFRGEFKADELQGEVLLPLEGTIAGTLSSDGEAFERNL